MQTLESYGVAGVSEPVAPGDEGGAPLDLTGTRRAPRFSIVEGVDVQVDGRPVALVDLSVVGAQVLSATRLRPSQRVRFTFEHDGATVRILSVVAWASFEIVKGAPRYRGAVDFFNADKAVIEQFIEAKRKRFS